MWPFFLSVKFSGLHGITIPKSYNESLCPEYAGARGAEGPLTDLLSFYTLPSSIIGNDKYDELNAAFMYYTVANTVPLQVP